MAQMSKPKQALPAMFALSAPRLVEHRVVTVRKIKVASSAFGDRVREQRELQKLSQQELGDEVGLGFQTIQLIETGKRIPLLPTLVRLCEALDCSPNNLLGWKAKPGRPKGIK